MSYLKLLMLSFLCITFSTTALSETNLDTGLVFKKSQKTFKGTLDRTKPLPSINKQSVKQLVFPKQDQTASVNNPWSKINNKQIKNTQQLPRAMQSGNPWAPLNAAMHLAMPTDVRNFEKNPYTNNENPFGMNQGFNGMPERFNNYYQNMASPYFTGINANPYNFAYGVNPLFALPNNGLSLPYNQNLWSNQQFWPQTNFLNSAMPYSAW